MVKKSTNLVNIVCERPLTRDFFITGRISIERTRRPWNVHHNRRHVIRQTPYSVAKTSVQIRILLSTYCDTDCRQRGSIGLQVRSFDF